MTYKESLSKCNELGLELYKVVSASQVTDILEYHNLTVSDEEFERICNVSYLLFLKSEEIPFAHIADALVEAWQSEGSSIFDLAPDVLLVKLFATL